MVKLNLNKEVMIELKEKSISIIRNKLNGEDSFKDDYIKHCIEPRIITSSDNKKYLKTQLWEIMHFFGDKMYLGVNPIPCGLDIFIDEDDFEDVNNF